MYKGKLQELCQRRSWSLPEYNTVKDGPDHVPRFTAVVVVNGQNFETPSDCKSSKEAQNRAARIAYEFYNAPSHPQVCLPSVSTPAVVMPSVAPLVPDEVHSIAHVPNICPLVQVSQQPLVPPLPSSLPIPPTGFLVPKNSIYCENRMSFNKEIRQHNCEDRIQTSIIYRIPTVSHNILHMYKNRLQQYAQKKNLCLPVYTSESQGPPHARLFKSRVCFDGKSYETSDFFPTLKEAEHAAAKNACQMLSVDKIQEDGGLYKNLLQELSQKMGFLCPSYETVRSGQPHRSIFVSTVVIGSDTFRGDEAKSKKHAEMNAAKVAYRALASSFPLMDSSNLPPKAGCIVSGKLKTNALHTQTTRDMPAKIEDAANAKKVKKSSPVNKTCNLLSSSGNSSDSPSTLAQLYSAVTNSVSVHPTEPHRTIDTKTVVLPRKLNVPIPEGATLLPCSDDKWVAYKVIKDEKWVAYDQGPAA